MISQSGCCPKTQAGKCLDPSSDFPDLGGHISNSLGSRPAATSSTKRSRRRQMSSCTQPAMYFGLKRCTKGKNRRRASVRRAISRCGLASAAARSNAGGVYDMRKASSTSACFSGVLAFGVRGRSSGGGSGFLRSLTMISAYFAGGSRPSSTQNGHMPLLSRVSTARSTPHVAHAWKSSLVDNGGLPFDDLHQVLIAHRLELALQPLLVVSDLELLYLRRVVAEHLPDLRPAFDHGLWVR